MPSLIFFEVGSQKLAIKTEFITEIIRAVAITRLPELLPPFTGVINYRGKVVPVIRMGDLPGFKSQATELSGYMLVIDNGTLTGLCLVVDQVTAFKTVDELLPVAELDNPGIQSRLTPEIVKLETELVPVLDISIVSKPAATILERPEVSTTNRLN
jgi:chemotaxis signal transduction protein